MSDLLFPRLRAVSYMLYLAKSSVYGMAVKSKPLALKFDIREWGVLYLHVIGERHVTLYL
jgi:hypothetical protein